MPNLVNYLTENKNLQLSKNCKNSKSYPPQMFCRIRYTETFVYVKYAQKKSKSMEKQLTTLEEIIVHSSNQIKISLKNKSELIMQLNLEIFELVCGCLYS